MTKELIERLRDTASKGVSVWGDLQMEAAKEIEILTAEREAYASAMDRMKAELAAIKAREPVGEVQHLDALNDAWLCKLLIGTKLYAKPTPPVREPDWLLETTKELAKAIHRDNYPDVPQWEVFNDLPGVISQIDNMVCGMERKKPVQAPLSYRDILRIYNEVGPEDGVPYRFAGAIEAITKEQK